LRLRELDKEGNEETYAEKCFVHFIIHAVTTRRFTVVVGNEKDMQLACCVNMLESCIMKD
jgi:hypothetical protein